MSDKTKADEELTREEAADRLQEVARDLREGAGFSPKVGNKTVELSPPAAVDYEIEVEERSPMIGKDHETVTIVLDWEVNDE